jgi:glycosyltransferase involved in cell wall biosynthesis
MRLSVIVPNLHSPLIADVVAALRGQTVAPDEIIVVGQDRHGLVAEGGPVRFVATPRPLSAAAARNEGARQAGGGLLLFIDSDCIAAPDLVERTLEAHRAGAQVASGGVAFETTPYWNLCDNLVALTPVLAPMSPGDLPYLPSLNFSIGRDLFWRAGGFDERFPGAAGEDTDLSFKLRKLGHRLTFIPGAVVAHRHARVGVGAVWHHLARFGSTWGQLQRMHRDLVGPSLRIRALRSAGPAAFPLAVALSVLDMLLTYIQYPALRAYWHAAPGIIWAKLAWHNGLIMYLQSASPEQSNDIVSAKRSSSIDSKGKAW